MIRRTGAIRDPRITKPGGIGEVERWVAPDGRVVAWLIVRYFKGENEYDYYVSA